MSMGFERQMSSPMPTEERCCQGAVFLRIPVAQLSGWRCCQAGDFALSPYLRTGGLVFFQVGTAFVTPTVGQLYDPTDGAVTVPTAVPDVP